MAFNEICSSIRSCLNSSKSQLSLAQLNRDYNEVLGENIPYRSLGYPSLEALIRAVPNIKISSIRGEIFIDVKPDEKTAHIANLVREQRTGKKKRKKSSRGGYYQGSVAPPRRPAAMPAAPRRSGPTPSYQSDYKYDRRRDSPSEQYQSQRRQNSYQSDSQYSRRRNSPPPPSSNNYSRRKDSSPPAPSSYLNHRNSSVIEISSNDENRNDQIIRKYRSHPSQYDFSDPNDFDDDIGSDFDDCEEINNRMEALKVTLGNQRRVSINRPKYRSYPSNTSNDDDYVYSSMKTTSKSGTKGGNLRRSYYQTPSSDSYDHDDEDSYDYESSSTTTSTNDTNGYASPGSSLPTIRRPFGRSNLLQGAYKTDELPRGGSRGRGCRLEEGYCKETTSVPSTCPGGNIKNEINGAVSESQPGEVSSKGEGDSICKMNVARGPAALLAAGRAMQEPNSKSTRADTRIPEIRPTSTTTHQHSTQNYIKHYLSSTVPTTPREPFKTSNLPQMNNNERPPSATSRLKRSPSTTSQPERPSPTTSPISETKPNVKTARSKMSDSNMFKPGPHVQPDLSRDVFCKKLHDFAIENNLNLPQFKNFVKFCPRTKAASYMCKIKIGSSLSFTSCPHESNLINDIYEYTAQIALEELQKTPYSTALPVTTDENLIIKRVAEIVNPHSAGLKSDTIESKYQLMHKQFLPSDWLDIVKNRSLLSVEELIGGSTAVYPVEGGINAHLDVSKLPPLVLPENEVWNVYVTCCTSTSNLYFRIIHDDYNGLYAVMDEKMFEMYESKREAGELHCVVMVKEGSYYAAYLENAWFRVKALSKIVDGFVRICLIDHGDIDEIEKENLFSLDERFTNLPAQKVSCCLTGLESYSNEPYVTRMVSELTNGKAFVAKVDTRNPSLQLTLLDTSTDSDINVNELIRERIEKELEPPKLPPQGKVTDTHLISVKEDGMAYVQICSESFKLLQNFLDEASEELASNFEKYCVTSSNELLGSKIFLARYASDGKWYRVVIDRVVSDEQIEVIFVDYGNIEVVTLNDIADVDHFTEALSIMPNQAVQVKLVKPNDELFTEKVLQFLMDLSLPKESSELARFLMKTVREGAIPEVNLFHRLPDTNQLVNVNDIIGSYFPEFRGPNHIEIPLSTVKSMSTTSTSNLLIKERKKVAKSTTRDTLDRIYPIPTCQVPLNNEQFHVYVMMVSNPSNFIVQPQANLAEFFDLKRVMNEFYAKEKPFVDVSNIQKDETYAVKKESDRNWYRGTIISRMNDSEVTVRLVDYGEIIAIKDSNIAQLLPCFRSLPRQAIKAELAGITPLHSDWSVDDSIRFKLLASGKLLIATVVEALENGNISVILYDTSVLPHKDLATVLVQEGRAKDITVY